MSNGKYILIKDVYDNDVKEHIGYGIAYRDETKEIIFEDISLYLDDLTRLAEMCNSLVLSPLHLSDVVEDFLVGMSHYKEEK